jgi:hypothetical protein
LYVLGGNNQEGSGLGSDASGKASKVDSSVKLGSDDDTVDWEQQRPSEISVSISQQEFVWDEQSTVPDATEMRWTIPFDPIGNLSLAANIIEFSNMASRLVSPHFVYPHGIPQTYSGMGMLRNSPSGPQSALSLLYKEMEKQNTLSCLTQIERGFSVVCDQALDLCRDLAKNGTRADTISNEDLQNLLAIFNSRIPQRLLEEFTTKIHDLRRILQVDVLRSFW